MSTLSKSIKKGCLAPLRSSLIEQIYSTITNPTAWTTVLQELVTCTDSRSARLLVMNTEASQVLSSFKLNIDDGYHQKYTDYYVNTCPWRRELSSKKIGQLYSTYLHFSCRQPEFYQSEFFNDWARPQDIHHGICGTIYRDSNRSMQLLVQRTSGQGYFTEADTFFVNNFIPHLQQSFLLSSQLIDNRNSSKAIAIAAGGERLPFLLLDNSLQIIYCTEPAEKMIASESELTVRNGNLQTINDKENRYLQDILRKSLAAADTREFDSLGGNLEITRTHKPNLKILVRPIHPDISVQEDAPPGYVAVYLYDTEAGINIDSEELRRFYSLSKAETRVATEMIISKDLAEAAKRCCVSMNTLRSHLKSIFIKTETHSQASLMKLLLSGPFKRH